MYECRHPAISMYAKESPELQHAFSKLTFTRISPTSQWQIQGIFRIWTLCVNVCRFETLGWLWRPQDLVQVISASPSFRRFLQRPKKITSHIDLMEFLDWRTFWNSNFWKKNRYPCHFFFFVLLLTTGDKVRQGWGVCLVNSSLRSILRLLVFTRLVLSKKTSALRASTSGEKTSYCL